MSDTIVTHGFKKRIYRKRCKPLGSCKAANRSGNLKTYGRGKRTRQVYVGASGGKYTITKGNRRVYLKSTKARSVRGKTHIGGGMYA